MSLSEEQPLLSSGEGGEVLVSVQWILRQDHPFIWFQKHMDIQRPVSLEDTQQRMFVCMLSQRLQERPGFLYRWRRNEVIHLLSTLIHFPFEMSSFGPLPSHSLPMFLGPLSISCRKGVTNQNPRVFEGAQGECMWVDQATG